MGTNVEWRDRVQSLAAQVERIIRFTGLSNRAVVWECDAKTVVLALPEVFGHAKFDGWSMRTIIAVDGDVLERLMGSCQKKLP
jgi:hypothetical protein